MGLLYACIWISRQEDPQRKRPHSATKDDELVIKMAGLGRCQGSTTDSRWLIFLFFLVRKGKEEKPVRLMCHECFMYNNVL
jgi:hypothetical protein